MEDNLFEEIDKNKKDLPKLDKNVKKLRKAKFNFYQYVSIVTFILCLVMGVLLGNVFPACSVSRGLYNNKCTVYEFNTSLTIIFWFISFLVCLFIFWLGHVIKILVNIEEKVKKLSK